MEFKIRKKENKNIHSYPTDDVKTAQKFAASKKRTGRFFNERDRFWKFRKKGVRTKKRY